MIIFIKKHFDSISKKEFYKNVKMLLELLADTDADTDANTILIKLIELYNNNGFEDKWNKEPDDEPDDDKYKIKISKFFETNNNLKNRNILDKNQLEILKYILFSLFKKVNDGKDMKIQILYLKIKLVEDHSDNIEIYYDNLVKYYEKLKEYYDNLKEDHDNLEKSYNNLKEDYDNLIDSGYHPPASPY